MSDLDSPIDEALHRLGEPEAEYRVSPSRLWVRLVIGVGLLLYGVIGNYLWWTFAPKKFNHVYFLLLILLPSTGFRVLFSLYRARGLVVLAYPTGLIRWQRGELESYPWSELTDIRIQTEQGEVIHEYSDNGMLRSTRIAFDPPWVRVNKAGITVNRKDDVSANFSPALENFDDLLQRVQKATFEVFWPEAWTKFLAGEPVTFDELEVQSGGIRFKDQLLPWPEVNAVAISGKNLTITRPGKWLPWASKEIDEIPNPHVLLGLIDMARKLSGATQVQDEETNSSRSET